MNSSVIDQSSGNPVPVVGGRLVRVANLAILAIALMCGLSSVAMYLMGRPALYRIAPLVLAAVFLACLWLPAVTRMSLAFSCTFCLASLYALEGYFAFFSTPRAIGHFPKQAGSFDLRSAFEVISDLRSRHVEAHADLAGRLPLASGKTSLASENGAILPLGGMSRQLIVFCNEGGQYITYQSDEHGFNNPAGAWARDPIAIAALGDSFTQGFCTSAGDGYVFRIRNHFPETISLGMIGNGPLLELATLREYLTAVKPKTVLWFFFEANDLLDLAEESRSPLLMKYLEQPAFSQNLIARQAEIDALWGQYEHDLMSAWEGRRVPGWLTPLADWVNDLAVENRNRNALSRFLRLREVRRRLEARVGRHSLETAQLPLLRATLARAKEIVASWGGSLHFVFLPGMDLLVNPDSTRARLARMILQQPENLGIPVIDVRDTFRSHPVGALFVYPDSHYSGVGAGLVAEAVLASLQHPAPAADLRSASASEVLR